MPLSATIVLCTFNGARFLEAQWNSLLVQSRRPDEIVVRDDASTDSTPALLDTLRKHTQTAGISVRFTRNAQNVGYVGNFEAALRAASGDVLLLCDQDDVWHPDKLATLLAEFEARPRLTLLCSDARRIDARGAPLPRALFEVLQVTRGELRRIHAGDGFGVLLRRSLATGATVALRRSLLADSLPVPAGWVHDEWLAISAAVRGGFDCSEQRLVDYRQHADNQLGMPDRNLAAKWRDLVKSRAALIAMLIQRDIALQQRVHALGSAVPAAVSAQIADKLQHLRTRAAMHGMPWARLVPVLREAASGRYRRYGTGWRSVLRDLVRRD